MKVPVLDTNKNILAPTTPRRAKILLREGKAAVFRRFPFTIILKKAVEDIVLPDLRLKIDPGSKTTGLAVIDQSTGDVVFAGELVHHGQAIKNSLDSRRALRRGRRSRKTRYRQPRFSNRTRTEKKLAPSLEHRILTTSTWVKRLCHFYPVSGLALELVKFDTQLMEKPDMNGIEYQRGTLYGFEVWEFLLEKWGRKCAYCKKEGVPLEKEHIIPRSRGGSDRASNLAPSCKPCNQKKGALTAKEFGHPEVERFAKLPLKDAAAMNSTRWALLEKLKSFGCDVETGSGGLTKFNRTERRLPKAHWIDAACVGRSTPEKINISIPSILLIKSMGHGSRQMCQTDKHGFPGPHRTRNKTWAGFQTGDIVVAEIPKGKFAGKHFGRVTIRQCPKFQLNRFDVHPKYLRKVHRADGYGYAFTKPPTAG